jgi:CubicO group peptidase (beta-lactamase class C family)
MSQDAALVGAWRGTHLSAGQRRSIAVDIEPTDDGLKAVWRFGGGGDVPASVTVAEGRVSIRSRQLDLLHEGPVGDELSGEVVLNDGAAPEGGTFRLRRDPAEFVRFSVPRLDATAQRLTTANYAPPKPLSDGWPVAGLAPAAVAKIEALIADILNEPRQICDGFLVARDGTIVAEEYFYGCGPETLHPIWSATKSVTALLCGIALDRGEFPSLDTPVRDLYPEYAERRWLREKYPITVRHALTMSAGIEWNEGSANYSDYARDSHRLMNATDDWIGYLLDRPLIHAPGTVFNYCSGLSILLGDILARCCGDVARYAEANLFRPLGIDTFAWRLVREGRRQTGGGLSLRMRDMARLGQLMLQGGRWGGCQVVPAAWIIDCVQVHARSPDVRYGYQWWLAGSDGSRPNDINTWSALGWGGQSIHVLPDTGVVIVHTGSDYDMTGPEGERRLAELRSLLSRNDSDD